MFFFFNKLIIQTYLQMFIDMYIHSKTYHLLYSEEVIIAQLQLSNFSAMSWQEQVTFLLNDNDVRFVLDQHA